MIKYFYRSYPRRQQLINLTVQHRKDVDTIKSMLGRVADPPAESSNNSKDGQLFEAIGVIRSVFNEKRAVPRQAALADELQGYVEIKSACFNNPEHSLEGLEEFSHLWIIYHFHKNEAHTKAKVAPPRLNGQRVGVFSTRSPHRPCAIGLSLVRFDRIEGNRIYFFGTDMVDGTPVFDLKPYIPKYDSPMAGTAVTHSTSTPFLCDREAPDGQETALEGASSASSTATTSNSGPSSSSRTVAQTNGTATVRVPNWITAGPTLKVLFNDQAISQIDEIGINRRTIVELLETDPRSVYLRTKHGSQIFTFQLVEAVVTCKFDDANATVTVVQVKLRN